MAAKTPTASWRLGVAYVGLALLASIIVARLYNLQVSDQERLRSWGEQISVRKEVVPAFRGSVLDRNGRPLAMSTPGMSVALDPTKTPRRVAGWLRWQCGPVLMSRDWLSASRSIAIVSLCMCDAT